MSILNQAGHQVQTSMASIGARQWRLNNWTQKYILGCGECPCDICSVPEPNQIYTLQYDGDGHITDETLDLSCVPTTNCTNGQTSCGLRIITLNNDVRNCELTGCNGVSVSEQKKIFVTHCDETPNSPNSPTPVRIYVTNNGSPVTEDEFGNPVQEYYLLGEGQLKFLCIVNGRITKIIN